MRRLGLKYLLHAIAIIIFVRCTTVVPQSWTSSVGCTSGPLGVARGIKETGTGLTFDPLWLLSDLHIRIEQIHNQNI